MNVVRGCAIEGDASFRTDIVVIGSGAGGAVVARELAEQGFDVLVLEEGPFVDPAEYGKYRPMQTFRRMARAGGSTVALGLWKTPTINILAGACVGGSSVLTGGVCFRVPNNVHEEWVTTLATDEVSAKAIDPFYARVEERIHVETVPEDMRSRGTVLFNEGCKKLGFELKPLRRNTKGCCGCARCNFGCPNGAKLSVDVSYLPQACERGARIHADHRVNRIVHLGADKVRVEGRLLSDADRDERGKFTVDARAVVLAAGTMHTPAILRRSGMARGNRNLGRHLTLHPAYRAVGVYDERIEIWKGALQSAYSDQFEDERLTFVSVAAPTSVLAATMPGFGPDLMDRVHNSSNISTFGFMVHDDGVGRVRRGFGREPVVTYGMSATDRAATRRGFELMGEILFASGAKEVLLPILGGPALRSMDEVRKYVHAGLDFRRLECLSFHPLGTARMATTPRDGVCDPNGLVFGTQNVWLADGSVLPTSVGVNTQVPIMAMATRIAFGIAETLRKRAPLKAA
jgi:choline dehydrogenase-like flavoprotein